MEITCMQNLPHFTSKETMSCVGYEEEIRSAGAVMPPANRNANSKRTRKVVENSAAQRRMAQVIANNNKVVASDDTVYDEADYWNLGLNLGTPPLPVCITSYYNY